MAALAPSEEGGPEEDEGGYRAITRQLHALGGGDMRREGVPPAPAGGLLASPTSGLFTRTMDMFGWGPSAAAAAAGGALAAARAALPPPAQVCPVHALSLQWLSKLVL